MNRSIYILVLALIAVCTAACKKETLLTYNAQDNIYFNYKEGGQNIDSTTITFAYSVVAVKDSIFKMPFAVTGSASNHDRTYTVTIDKSSTAIAGQHYIAPTTFVLHANRLTDTMFIKVLRSADLQNQTVRLKLNLLPSADFHTDIKSVITVLSTTINTLSFKLDIADILGPGKYWSSMTPYFGTFSIKKVRLINQVAGMPLNYYISAWLYDLQGSARLALYAITTARYLSDQKALGHTIYEDDGVTPMQMGAAYQ